MPEKYQKWMIKSWENHAEMVPKSHQKSHKIRTLRFVWFSKEYNVFLLFYHIRGVPKSIQNRCHIDGRKCDPKILPKLSIMHPNGIQNRLKSCRKRCRQTHPKIHPKMDPAGFICRPPLPLEEGAARPCPPTPPRGATKREPSGYASGKTDGACGHCLVDEKMLKKRLAPAAFV